MTNVTWEKSRRMVEYKQRESKDNLESVFDCINEFGNPVSAREILQRLDKLFLDTAKRDAQEKYERGEIVQSYIYEHIRKNKKRISLRTVQRALNTLVTRGSIQKSADRYSNHSPFQRALKGLVTRGSIQKSADRYSLTEIGRREAKFRQFTESYGTMSLNGLMDLNFPTLNTLDKNLDKLVKIFGIYVVYALIETTRLIVTNKSGSEEHWHSDYNSCIKDVFNPWHMLNLFLTAVLNSNERKSSENNIKKEKTLIEHRIKQYQNENFPQIVDVDSIHNTPAGDKINPSTLDLMFEHISEVSENSGVNKSQSIDLISKHFHHIKIRSRYGSDTLLYEPDSERIEKLKNSLKKRYPVYYELLLKIDELFYSK